jgi:hypothetical protein
MVRGPSLSATIDALPTDAVEPASGAALLAGGSEVLCPAASLVGCAAGDALGCHRGTANRIVPTALPFLSHPGAVNWVLPLPTPGG